MRSIPFFILCLILSFLLYLCCTAPVEQNHIEMQRGGQLLYFDRVAKTNVAWASDSSKVAFQTPVGLVSLVKYSHSGELLDSLVQLNVPFINERIVPVYLSPNGELALYQGAAQQFSIFTLATRQHKSFWFLQDEFATPMRWAPDGERIYGVTVDEDYQFFFKIVDRHTSDVQSIILDSLGNNFLDAKLYEKNQILYSGTDQNSDYGLWYRNADGQVTRISKNVTGDMTLFDDSGVIVYWEHDSENGKKIIKKYSITDQTTTVLNEDMESIWEFSRIPNEQSVHFGGRNEAGQLGIFTLSLDGRLRQHSNWWPFGTTQWADDGQSIVTQELLDENLSSIQVYDLVSEDIIELTNNTLHQQNHTPVFTSNAQNVIFSQNQQLVRVPANGGDRMPLTTSNTPQFNPDVSPNGLWVVCDDGKDIYVVSVDGGELRKISDALNMSLTNPTWSPDGRKIACQTPTTLEILKLDGEQLSEYKSYPGHFKDIEWAPAETPPFGAPILYRKDYYGIATINPETGQTIDDFLFSANLYSFCWSANGRSIIYTTPYYIVHTPLLSSLSQ